MEISPYERTKRWLKSGLAVILIGVGLLVFRAWDKRKIQDITKEELKNGEKTAIIVDPKGRITTLTRHSSKRGGKEKQRDTVSVVKGSDGARGTRISIDKDGNVKLTERRWGFCADPNIGIYTTTKHSRVFAGLQIAFYKRHGLDLNLAASIDGSKQIRVGVGYSYLLPFLNNTSTLVGIDNDKQIFTGIKVKL